MKRKNRIQTVKPHLLIIQDKDKEPIHTIWSSLYPRTAIKLLKESGLLEETAKYFDTKPQYNSMVSCSIYKDDNGSIVFNDTEADEPWYLA